MIRTFLEFVDKKHREENKKLKILKRVFAINDFKVVAHISNQKNEDSYLFVYSKDINIPFGLRFYTLGDKIAYRVQKGEKTQPYGDAYSLDIEELYNDILSDDKGAQEIENDDKKDDKEKEKKLLSKSEKAANQVIDEVVAQIEEFFHKSALLDKKEKLADKEDMGALGYVDVRSGLDSDYSSKVFDMTR